MMKNRQSIVRLLIFACLGSGCSQLPSPAGCPLCTADADSPAVRRAYAKALRDAEHPKPREVADDLVALVPANGDLVWSRDGKVLMVTWTMAKYYSDEDHHAPGKGFPLAVESWFTAAPFVQQYCRGLKLDGPKLARRLQQRIGLPPTSAKDSFLAVWIDPRDLVRPCPDPEVTDPSCRLDVYAHDRRAGRVKKRHRLPWACDPARARPGEEPADPEQLRWLCGNWKKSFENGELYANYPWTALGYTYDWGDPADPRGASEFVAPQGTEVVFHSLTPTADYCTAR